jgi:hypothetical protein
MLGDQSFPLPAQASASDSAPPCGREGEVSEGSGSPTREPVEPFSHIDARAGQGNGPLQDTGQTNEQHTGRRRERGQWLAPAPRFEGARTWLPLHGETSCGVPGVASGAGRGEGEHRERPSSRESRGRRRAGDQARAEGHARPAGRCRRGPLGARRRLDAAGPGRAARSGHPRHGRSRNGSARLPSLG